LYRWSDTLKVPGWGRLVMARIETEDRGVAAMEAARNVLAPGEKLLWTDRPRPWAVGAHNLFRLAAGMPVAAVIFAFWAFFLFGHSQADVNEIKWPIAITIGGLWLLGSPLWAALIARRLVYAITDRRLMIIGGIFARRVTSYSATAIETIDCRENEDKSGDIIFRRIRQMDSPRFGILDFVRIDYSDGFFGIGNVRRVEELARQLAPAV
jgi:hypothetical protein